MVTKDAAASIEYSKCKAKHQAVVDYYDLLREVIQNWIDRLNTEAMNK